MSREAMDTNCMTLTRFILAEQKKYAPGGTGIYRKTYGKGMNKSLRCTVLTNGMAQLSSA